MGGARQTGKFARFFVAPGVGHCGDGQGAAPTGLLDAVVLTRPICRFPLVARHSGHGSTARAKNFTCAGN